MQKKKPPKKLYAKETIINNPKNEQHEPNIN